MKEHFERAGLSRVPEENEMLDQLTNIEQLLTQGKLDAARDAVLLLAPLLQRHQEVRSQSELFQQIENRLTRIDLQLNAADAARPTLDGTGETY